MPDRDGEPIDIASAARDPHDDALVAAALRALPDAAPQPDLWPDIARTLAARRRPRTLRWPLPVALAAALLLALLLPRTPAPPDAPSTPSTPATATTSPTTPALPDADDELDHLRARSQTLERWVAAVAARAPQSSRDLMAAVEVEDLIGLVDLQLGAATATADALPLWRQRVALLEDLATIRGSAFVIAAHDGGVAAVDATVNRIN